MTGVDRMKQFRKAWQVSGPAGALRLCGLIVLLWAGTGYAQMRVAHDADGNPVSLEGSVVLIEPDIELSLVMAGGLNEPRREWSDAARIHYPAAVRAALSRQGVAQLPDYDIPDMLAPASQLGQVIRLYQAVSESIALFSQPNSALATKDATLDWTLGPGVRELRQHTGADYGLFTYVRDSYASGGRTALRTFAMIGGALLGTYIDIGGGMQLGLASLVDLQSGEVVWFNLMARGSGDLRDREGADDVVEKLLQDLPL
jgi:hypothetical protein